MPEIPSVEFLRTSSGILPLRIIQGHPSWELPFTKFCFMNCTRKCIIHCTRYITDWWFGTCFIFPYIGNVIIPTDELIFFRGVETTINQVTIHQFCVLIFLAVSESFAARYEDRPDRADRPRSLLPSFDTVLNETPRQSFSLTYQDKDADRSRHWQVTVFISHYMWLFCTNFPCVFG